MPRSLYLHVPFCPAICPYCDFHKMLRNEGLVEAYLARLEHEARALAERFPGPLDTIYLGGGTPSHLTDPELERLVGALDRAWGFPARLETTLEADPKTFDRARLQRFRELGFDRVSIGLQSSQDEVLRFLGRQHDGREGLLAVEDALASGLRVSADLITAVAGQDAERDLHALAATGVPHVSVYTLTIEGNTPFARRGVRVDEDRAADDYELAAEVLAGYGLERYEVSSHARPGEESRHNQAYWHGDHFLALGPSAASFVPAAGALGARRTNGPLKAWLRGDAPTEERVEADDYVLEVLMTGLRTRRGVDLERLRERSGVDAAARFAPVLEEAERHGLLTREGARLRATDAGLIRLDALLRRLFAHAAA